MYINIYVPSETNTDDEIEKCDPYEITLNKLIKLLTATPNHINVHVYLYDSMTIHGIFTEILTCRDRVNSV